MAQMSGCNAGNAGMKMARMPDQRHIADPLLRMLQESGTERRIADLVEPLADHFGLTPEQRAERTEHNAQTRFRQRVHWAVRDLKRAGLAAGGHGLIHAVADGSLPTPSRRVAPIGAPAPTGAAGRTFDLDKAQHGVWHSVESRIRHKSKTLLPPDKRVTKASEVARLLGYGKTELVAHFDALLNASPEFNWRNKSGHAPIGTRTWDVDHLLPIKDAKTFEEVLERSALSNLRPMWKHHNAAKGAFAHALAIGPRDELIAELKVARAMLDDGSVEAAKVALDAILAGLSEP